VNVVGEIGDVWEPCHELAVLYKGVRISYTIVISFALFLCEKLTYLAVSIDDRWHSRYASAADQHHPIIIEPAGIPFRVLCRV
jgi:hypothetical protein